jgi:hypothetical protein
MSALASASSEISNCVLNVYGSACTNYFDLQPTVLKSELLSAGNGYARNGFTLVGGIRTDVATLANGLLSSKIYYVVPVMPAVGAPMTNLIWSICCSNYANCDGAWVPRLVQVRDLRLPRTISLTYFIDLESPFKVKMNKYDVYPDIRSSPSTSMFDRRIGSKHYYIKHGAWPSRFSNMEGAGP